MYVNPQLHVDGAPTRRCGRPRGCAPTHRCGRPQGCAPTYRCGRPQGYAPTYRCGRPRGCAPTYRCGRPRGCAPAHRCGRSQGCAPTYRCGRPRGYAPTHRCGRPQGCAPTYRCGRPRGYAPTHRCGRSQGCAPTPYIEKMAYVLGTTGNLAQTLCVLGGSMVAIGCNHDASDTRSQRLYAGRQAVLGCRARRPAGRATTAGRRRRSQRPQHDWGLDRAHARCDCCGGGYALDLRRGHRSCRYVGPGCPLLRH